MLLKCPLEMQACYVELPFISAKAKYLVSLVTKVNSG